MYPCLEEDAVFPGEATYWLRGHKVTEQLEATCWDLAKTIEYPSFPSRSGIEDILPPASSCSRVHATTRRGLDTDHASSAIQQPKECQRTSP